MMVINCTEDFHWQYYKYSTTQEIKVPIPQKPEKDKEKDKEKEKEIVKEMEADKKNKENRLKRLCTQHLKTDTFINTYPNKEEFNPNNLSFDEHRQHWKHSSSDLNAPTIEDIQNSNFNKTIPSPQKLHTSSRIIPGGININIQSDFENEGLENTQKPWNTTEKQEQQWEYFNKIIQAIHDTRMNKRFLKKVFLKLDLGADNLMDGIINAYSEYKAKKWQSENPVYYELAFNYLSDWYKNPNIKIYYEIQCDDMIFIMCCVIKYYTTLNIKLELGDIPTNVMIILYGDEEQYNFLASLLNYELQLKPYATQYELLRRDYNKKQREVRTFISEMKNNSSITNSQIDEDSLMIQMKAEKTLQFEDWDEEKPWFWPPYIVYNSAKDVKFRRYEKDDSYHECKNIPIDKEMNCKECNKFRNTDKLRLINSAIDKIFNISFWKQSEILVMVLYKRNFVAYDNKWSVKGLLQKSWNIFNNSNWRNLTNMIRNFYGETFSYYFLWWDFFTKWWIFPSVFGGIIWWFDILLPYAIEPKRIGKTPITYIDILMMIFCAIITIWVTLSLKTWKQKERFYAYWWGTENYIKTEPDKETFVPDANTEFIFGEQLSIIYPVNRNIKKFISYWVWFAMIVVTCSCTFLLFFWKSNYLYSDTPSNFWANTCISMIFASINAIQIKIMNVIYTYLALKLNNWENYQKENQRINDWAIKWIMFQFMNCYSACFYIGFVKPNINEPCAGTCIQEIEAQLYTTFAIKLALNFLEIWIPFILYKFREWKYKKSVKKYWEEHKNSKWNTYKTSDQNQENAGEIEQNPNNEWSELDYKEITNIKMHSATHQMLCNEAEDLIYEYNDIIILFGYVCLFSVCAPLTPLIVLFVIWVEKFVDWFKLFHLTRVNTLEKSTGVGIYNTLMKSLMFAGMITNIGVVLFSKELKMGDDLFYKIAIFLCVENFILILIYSIDWNILPNWFAHVVDLKELYDKKYLKRNESNLPHLKFTNAVITGKEYMTVPDKNEIDFQEE